MASHQDNSQSVVSFQQQGTVDWTSVTGGSVTFPIDVLSRLSKAGVEAFTLVAAQTIFSDAKLGRQGEVRMNKAIDSLSAFPSFGKLLWFGFGIKHIVRSMQDSAEGLACVAVCASLTEHLGPQARTFGNCLGSAARFFLGNMRDEVYVTDATYQSKDREALPPISCPSYGKGFCFQALELLLELNQIPDLRQTMEAAAGQSYEQAIEKYLHSLARLGQLCSCNRHCSDSTVLEGNSYCLLVLAPTVCTLVRTMSAIDKPGGLEMRPSRRGMEMLYENQYANVPSQFYGKEALTEDFISAISWPKISILQLSHIIFTGREHSYLKLHSHAQNSHTAAISHYGLCFSLDTLMRTTSDPEEACRVTMIPGRIEWNGLMFDSIRDSDPGGWEEGIRQNPYHASSPLTDITTYDNLEDSSSPNLQAELVVIQAATETRSLRVAYRISTPKFPGHHFAVGPAMTWSPLNRAYTASSCHGKVCKSLNGFRSSLVQGEGLLIEQHELAEPGPIVRVLSSQNLAIWVAVSVRLVDSVEGSVTPVFEHSQARVALNYRLQMGQCVRCCVVGSENYRTDVQDEDPLHVERTVCLITSP